MARLLDCNRSYITRIETDDAKPGKELIVPIAKHYRVDEAQLRVAWKHPHPSVGSIATDSPLLAEMTPKLLEAAKGLSAPQLDKLIEYADSLSRGPTAKPDSLIEKYGLGYPDPAEEASDDRQRELPGFDD